MMRLQHSAANQAWVFTFGQSLIRLEPPNTPGRAPLLFKDRLSAVAQAAMCGLLVDVNGVVGDTSDRTPLGWSYAPA